MIMIQCLAIDDEPLALRQMEKMILQVPFLELIGLCSTALEAQRIMQTRAVDALFVDIQMPDLNGMDFVRSLAHPPLVVFTTAYSQYAIDGYKVDAVDYLLKPFGIDEFTATAHRLQQRYNLLHNDLGSFVIRADYQSVNIPIKDIVYIESQSEYLRLHMASGKRWMTLMSLYRMVEQLPATHFVQIHRSYVVNIHCVNSVSRHAVTLNDGTQLSIGDSYRNAFVERFNNAQHLG